MNRDLRAGEGRRGLCEREARRQVEGKRQARTAHYRVVDAVRRNRTELVFQQTEAVETVDARIVLPAYHCSHARRICDGHIADADLGEGAVGIVGRRILRRVVNKQAEMRGVDVRRQPGGAKQKRVARTAIACKQGLGPHWRTRQAEAGCYGDGGDDFTQRNPVSISWRTRP